MALVQRTGRVVADITLKRITDMKWTALLISMGLANADLAGGFDHGVICVHGSSLPAASRPSVPPSAVAVLRPAVAGPERDHVLVPEAECRGAVCGLDGGVGDQRVEAVLGAHGGGEGEVLEGG